MGAKKQGTEPVASRWFGHSSSQSTIPPIVVPVLLVEPCLRQGNHYGGNFL